jgi:YD repeat-containing protein
VVSVSSVVDYSYLPGSWLIASVSNSAGFASLREYEGHRDLITDINNQWNGNLVSSFAYENDAVGRRIARIDATSSLAVTNTFGYNIRSEVIEAAMPGLIGGGGTYNYDYDPIGNRLSEIKDLMSGISTNLYASNELNQYTNIANGSVVEPQYDLDGNMTSYNGWTFTWNGENRLITASNGTTVVENAYDYMGRRFAKTVYDTADLGTPTSDLRYIYDGWNLISESKVQGLESNVSYYVWGLDLSGTLQGAGGIGGLLTVSSVSGLQSSVYSPAYDANGNITEYVDLADGSIVAHYQYDAFGNTITQSGPEASSFPHRFSTKYTDDETGFLYYGYRYYNPNSDGG